jgi:hypothetical protein
MRSNRRAGEHEVSRGEAQGLTMVINLETAEALRLAIEPAPLAITDRVIA